MKTCKQWFGMGLCAGILGLPAAQAARVTQVVAAYEYSLALLDNGTVCGWGYNYSGQLGEGSFSNRYHPTLVSGLSNVRAISARGEFALALKNDGTVWAWGNNYYGQLGDGTRTEDNGRSAAGPVSSLSSITAIAAGQHHALALKSDGTVWTWGDNYYGQLGDGTTSSHYTPIRVTGLAHIVAIAAGWCHSLALKDDGTILAWGYGGHGQLGDGAGTERDSPVQVAKIFDATAVWSGGLASYAMKSDGTVWAWGDDQNGALGRGAYGWYSFTPVQTLGLTNIVALSASDFHVLAARDDGTLFVWGRGHEGQLGDGLGMSRCIPYALSSPKSAANVAAGSWHSLALQSDGSLWSWGWDGQGELDQMRDFYEYLPLPVTRWGTPDIQVNNMDGSVSPVSVRIGSPLALAVSMADPALMATPSDWWLVADTPFGLYFWVLPGNWTTARQPAYQGPLSTFGLMELFRCNTAGLPAGIYTFCFGVDSYPDGQLGSLGVSYKHCTTVLTP